MSVDAAAWTSATTRSATPRSIGIFIADSRSQRESQANLSADVTVRNNTVGPISDDDDFPFGAGPNQAETHGIRIESRNDSVLRLDIAGNSADGSAATRIT